MRSLHFFSRLRTGNKKFVHWLGLQTLSRKIQFHLPPVINNDWSLTVWPLQNNLTHWWTNRTNYSVSCLTCQSSDITPVLYVLRLSCSHLKYHSQTNPVTMFPEVLTLSLMISLILMNHKILVIPTVIYLFKSFKISLWDLNNLSLHGERSSLEWTVLSGQLVWQRVMLINNNNQLTDFL